MAGVRSRRGSPKAGTTVYLKSIAQLKKSIKALVHKWFETCMCEEKSYIKLLFCLDLPSQNINTKLTKTKLTSILRLTEKTYYSTLLLEQQRTKLKEHGKYTHKVINKNIISKHTPNTS